MAGEFNIGIGGIDAVTKALLALAPDLRKGPAKSALRAGMKPILAAAVAATPELKADVYQGRILVRRAGTLKRALTIRNSTDTNKTGDVGVILNYKPLTRNQIRTFKAETGRAGSQNASDPFFWRWIEFATRRNRNPAKALQKSGELLVASALPIVGESLAKYIQRLNQKLSGKA